MIKNSKFLFVFLATLSLFFVFNSAEAGFFDWFKWFNKGNLQDKTETIPNISNTKKTSESSSQKIFSSNKSSTVSSKISSSSYSDSFSAGSINNWGIYRNEEFGFEFKYPTTWKASFNDREGSDYKVMARIVNPKRAGVTDTDAPIETFLVRRLNYPCKGKNINWTGKSGTDTGWDKGFGDIYYRTLCFKTEGWPITISLSAYDYPSQAIMDQILSTFKFTEHADSSLPSSAAVSKQPSSNSSNAVSCNNNDKLGPKIPIITSLSSYSGAVGTKLEVRGCNFAGFESDINAWIENSQGTQGILYGKMGSTPELIKITLKTPLCSKDHSYSGLPCKEWLDLVPGEYKIYVKPWGKKSNEVNFTITGSNK